MRQVRAFMGLGHTSARRGALVWLGGAVTPRAVFHAERLILQAIDGRRWGGHADPPVEPDVLEVNGNWSRLHGAPSFPMTLQPDQAIRIGIDWNTDGAHQVAAGLFGWWEADDLRLALMQPPGMRQFVIHDLGEIPGPQGSETLTYDEIESAFVTEWNRVLTPICGPEWWNVPRPGELAGKTKAN